MSSSLVLPACAQDRMHFINLGICNSVVHCIYFLDDCVDEKRLSESVDRLVESEPILKCQWVDSYGYPRWVETETDPGDRFRLVEAIDVQQELNDFMSAPLDPRVDSLVQGRIFRPQGSGALKDILCFKMSHVVTDVAGLRYFLERLGDTYGKLRDDPDYHPPQPATERNGWQVFWRLPFKQKVRLFQKGKKDLIDTGEWQIPYKNQIRKGMMYTSRTLDQEQLSALVQYAKEKRSSLNQVMFTGFARALHRFTGAKLDTALPLINTLNLRHYLRRERTPGICNLSVPLFPKVVFQEGDSFEQTLIQVKREMLDQKKSVPGVFQALFMEVLFLAPFALAQHLFSGFFEKMLSTGTCIPLFSDGGSANLEIPGHTTLHVYGTGPIVYPPTLMVTVSSFKNTITFATGFCEEAIPRESIEHFFDLVVEELSVSNLVPAETAPVL